MGDLTFCTASMGRLHHLLATLPRLAAEGPVSLCDWSCPDHCGKWAATVPNVSVISIPNRKTFNVSQARNAAAYGVETQWLAFIDCDLVVPEGFGARIEAALEPNTFLWFGKWVSGLAGFIVCEKAAWKKVGKYPPDHSDYGYEDSYFYECLKAIGVKEKILSDEGVRHLKHTGEDSTRFYDEKNTGTSWERNKAIFEARFKEFQAQLRV